jgi:hypothetical protein
MKGISFSKLNENELAIYAEKLKVMEKYSVAVRSRLANLIKNKEIAVSEDPQARINIWLEKDVNDFISDELKKLRTAVLKVGSIGPKIGATIQAALKEV